jgi:phosphosulfolactate synthase
MELMRAMGVRQPPAASVPMDPGHALVTLEGHLAQSAHLMAGLKISMAGWLIADEGQTRRKLEAARAHGVPTTSGGGPLEIALAQGRLIEFLDLCAELGFDRVEYGESLPSSNLEPETMVGLARERGLELQSELGRKHGGPMTSREAQDLVDQGRAWLDAGAACVVIEARESAEDVGLFDARGSLDGALASHFAEGLGLARVVFEAPTKPSQFALLDHLGPEVRLGNVRLDELLRVEIYRRGLHTDAFGVERLRPAPIDRGVVR